MDLRRALAMIALAWMGATLCVTQANARLFSNQFVEFELPPKWDCTLEGTEWVCQNSNKDKKKEAIIILAAKLRGDQDTFEEFENHLKKPKEYKSVKGQPIRSESRYVKQIKILDHAWVDSLHLESEVPGFYTRYLATTKQDIAVLVTYSINKNKWSEYDKDFETLVRTLRVFRKAGPGINAKARGSDLFNITVPSGLDPNTIFPNVASDQGKKKKKKSDDNELILLVLALAGIIGYVVWRKKRGG